MSPSPFTISEFSEAQLYEALSNEFVTITEVAAHERARYLYGYLNDIHAKTIIVEYEYTDRDYLDDFAAYYVRCFAPYKRRCKRLHFFSEPLARDTFLQLIRGSLNQDDYERVVKAYLGFIVARPLPDAIIGRTSLVTYPSDNGRRNYTCTRDDHANLFGSNSRLQAWLSKSKIPFSRCAQPWLCGAVFKKRETYLIRRFQPRLLLLAQRSRSSIMRGPFLHMD